MIKFIQSFKYAFCGVWTCIKSERNFRVHIAAALAVLIFSCIYGIDGTHFSALALTVFFVMAAEAVNTSIEAVVDLVSHEKTELAKIAKDTAAGAVLLSAVCALIVAAVTFSDMSRLAYAFLVIVKMPNLIFTVLFIGASAFFVFGINNKIDN